mmetsp:Transcript_4375/g.6020  ORF Transcript_4375/g.6020 Transcript_4375/m.6020 type:complete len:165 (-) Transcript_4375:154-648(-)
MIDDFKYSAEEQFPDLFRSIQVDVKASIDFIVFVGKHLENFRQLIPPQITCAGYQFIYRDTNDSPTIQYDSEAKCENIEKGDEKSVVVELSDHSAIVVSCNDDIEFGLMWTTKQCFGYTSRGQRCKNRRSTAIRHAWCHHHLGQEAVYKSDPTPSSTSFVPEWW